MTVKTIVSVSGLDTQKDREIIKQYEEDPRWIRTCLRSSAEFKLILPAIETRSAYISTDKEQSLSKEVFS